MDPTAVALTVGTGVAIKPLLEKLLGPSFEYVGKALAGLLERYGNKNVDAIFRRAASLLEHTRSPGLVDPRVLRSVIEDGSFASDPLSQTYFASILASSRTPSGAEDRALLFLTTLKSLSTAEVALHYKYYYWLRETFSDAPFLLSDTREHNTFALFVRANMIDESDTVRADDAVIGLANAGLIGSTYELGKTMRQTRARFVDGRVLTPSHFGARLFLWVHGHPNEAVDALLRGDLEFWSHAIMRVQGSASPIGLHRRRLALAEKIDASLASLAANADMQLARQFAEDAKRYLWPEWIAG
jgi:hypothetical protein